MKRPMWRHRQRQRNYVYKYYRTKGEVIQFIESERELDMSTLIREIKEQPKPEMTLNQYQDAAMGTAIYPKVGRNLAYPALKLCGEAGEVAEKIGKLMRDKGYEPGMATEYILDKVHAQDLLREVGDVLWYVAALCEELGYTLEAAAQLNLGKLADRSARGMLGGNGDNR